MVRINSGVGEKPICISACVIAWKPHEGITLVLAKLHISEKSFHVNLFPQVREKFVTASCAPALTLTVYVYFPTQNL